MPSINMGSAALTQNHPRIISVVTNNTEIYQAVTGGLKMFSGLISERGPEKVKTLNSPEELIALYGSLDIKKYGQATYNVQRWLQSGGNAVVRRIMPDDATFSHVYLNIRSKKVGDDLYIQPVVSSIGGASTEDILSLNLEKEGTENYDGFKDNVLLQIIPVGRGKSYNSLGFRLYANKQYDNYLNFRLYNFEVVEFNKNGSVNIIEGPFAVSLYRDALSPVNDESIFIEDVVNKYSENVKVQVNDAAIIAISTEISPDASNPYIVDPIFGETRLINGSEEKINGKDVHYSLIKTNNGEIITNDDGTYAKRIYSAENTFDTYRIDMEDSKLREEYDYLVAKRPIEMLKFLGDIKAVNTAIGYGEGLTDILTGKTSAIIIDDTRELISRCLVGGYNIASLLTHLKTYMDNLLENELNTELKVRGTSELDSFELFTQVILS